MGQTLSEIKLLLKAHNLRPKPQLGQHFLHDANLMRRIVEVAEIAPSELVLEVGAGTGSLSEFLLQAGAHLVTVEIDRELKPILLERLVGYGDRVTLVIDDVLAGKHGLSAKVLDVLKRHGGSFKLVGNLPYNVASPLIANLVCDQPQMTHAIVMVQREVADRLTASPASKAYGAIGILIQAMCEVKRIMTLNPSCFWPKPRVQSSVVVLRRRAQPLTDDPHALARTLQQLFQKRRKQIRNILGRDPHLLKDIDATSRPEQLSVEQITMLSQKLNDPLN